jgi:hypothetical protein
MRTRVGIIGDKAGAGKSYVILALVAAGRGTRVEPDPVVRSFADDRVVLTTRRNRWRVVETTLLVVPHNLCSQWEVYIARWNGNGNARPLRHMSINRTKHVAALRERGALDAIDLVVVTSTFYNAVAATIATRACDQGARLRRVVYDEADSICIAGLSRVEASFHWFVTASYRNMIYPFGDGSMLSQTQMTAGGIRSVQRTTGVRSSGFIKALWSELGHDAMSRSVAHAVVAKNADAYVDASMVLPDPEETVVLCRAPAAIRVLSGVAGVDRAILQCLNAGDVDTALQHVDPANRGSEDNVIRALMARIEREAHNLEVRLGALAGMAYANEDSRTAERSRIERKRDELQRRITTIRERVAGADVCCICYDAFSNKTVAPCCSNAFCFGCISRWLLGEHAQRYATPGHALRPGACPLCKATLTTRDLLVVDADRGPAAALTEEPSSEVVRVSPEETSPAKDKLENLEAILRTRCATPGSAKVLIFSSFDNSFPDIVRVLDRCAIRHRFLKGHHFAIAGIERAYRDGDLDVLLVNTSNYGSGLNFENTTDVVMLHKFDTDIEHQVLGRAQRCGRTAPLKVWYLLHDNE